MCNLLMFIISQSVHPQTAFPKLSNVVGKARSLPQSGPSERFFTQVGYNLTCKRRLDWMSFSRDKHSSLLQTFLNYRYKNLYTILAWSQMYLYFNLAIKQERELGEQLREESCYNCAQLSTQGCKQIRIRPINLGKQITN